MVLKQICEQMEMCSKPGVEPPKDRLSGQQGLEGGPGPEMLDRQLARRNRLEGPTGAYEPGRFAGKHGAKELGARSHWEPSS